MGKATESTDGKQDVVHFPTIEEKILAQWRRQAVFKQSIDATKGKPLYTFMMALLLPLDYHTMDIY